MRPHSFRGEASVVIAMVLVLAVASCNREPVSSECIHLNVELTTKGFLGWSLFSDQLVSVSTYGVEPGEYVLDDDLLPTTSEQIKAGVPRKFDGDGRAIVTVFCDSSKCIDLTFSGMKVLDADKAIVDGLTLLSNEPKFAVRNGITRFVLTQHEDGYRLSAFQREEPSPQEAAER